MRHHLALALALTALSACTAAPATDSEPGPDACNEEPTGEVNLPDDESVHEEFVEWWYWTGHLEDEQGRYYGFEETFFVFQTGMHDFTMAHVAVTDTDAGRFDYDAVYVEALPDPEMTGIELAAGSNTASGREGHDTLHGETKAYALDLDLVAEKPPVFQHEDGYHDYEAGGYTWYYSRARMAVTGTLELEGETRAVTGQGWMDHQWGDLLLMSTTGWDWFAIQLDDDREIMLFMVRGSEEAVGGSITDAGCITEELGEDEIEVTALGEWTSTTSGCTYPHGWSVKVGDLELTVTPVMEDQELYNEHGTYWEGASTVSGDASGRAYVELAGHCG